MTGKDEMTQADKFKEAARKLEADQNEGRWKERLRKVVKVKREKAK